MPQEGLPHIFLSDSAEPTNYTSLSARGSELNLPDRNREQHSQRLKRLLQDAWNHSGDISEQRRAVSLPTKSGIYLEFKSQGNADLITKSLEHLGFGVRLLNVKEVEHDESKVVIATVYVPSRKEGYFLNKIQQYVEPNEKGKFRNEPLVRSIEDIRLAVIESFWQDPQEYIPDEIEKWCEVWIRTGITFDEAEHAINSFKEICQRLEIEYQEDKLYFPERAVILIKANRKSLGNLIESSDVIAEFRIAKETADYWVELPPSEQAEWVRDLQQRLRVNQDSNVAITILDGGVNNGHELLAPVLADSDCHSHKEHWGVEDQNGHGTNMAGLAVFGDLQKHLDHSDIVEILHKIESAKILPPSGENNKREWGSITQNAINRVEIQAPTRTHIGCMAVTSAAFKTDKGRPSSWSAAIDSLTSGDSEEDDIKRLFILSAGNIRNSQDFNIYPESNMAASVENPGQSWNALTVGAYTQKKHITNPDFQDHSVVASYECLSPYSTTSWSWERNKWPYKPDIVFEGGNLAKSPDNFIGNLEDLEVLTTHHKIAERQFNTINGTSSATAQAAWMAAQIQSAYPNAWPETIRALMIHSATWTDAMMDQFGINYESNKSKIADMLKICGYGVPNLHNAISCAQNRFTLIAQEYIQPFDKKPSGGYCMKDMHVHTLPWPREVLLALGETEVQLKITLSYFIEPGPGEIGWKDRYRYPSHALRFDLNSPGELDKKTFLQRLNKAARDNEYNRELAPESGADRWVIGKDNRKMGSIHSDIWKGTAAQIATCNMVGVYPVIGWWRERHHLGRWNRRARYSLIVSLHTPRQDVDIYTPVANQIRIPIST